LSPVEPVTFQTKFGMVITTNTRKVGEEEVKNAKQWLRTRLIKIGCDPNVLRVNQEVVTVRRSDGTEIAVRYQNEKVFELY
jgi:hypothetical protein